MFDAAILAIAMFSPQEAAPSAPELAVPLLAMPLLAVPLKRITPAQRPAAPAGPAIGAHRDTRIVMTAADGAPGARRAVFATRGTSVGFALAWEEGDAQARWSVDTDGDGKIVESETQPVAVIVSAAPPRPFRRVQFQVPSPIRIGGRDHHVQLRRIETGAFVLHITGSVDHWIGDADLEGRPHRLWILDVDDDGEPGSERDMFAFLPTETYLRVARLDATSGPVFEAGEAAFLGARRVGLAGVGADGSMRLRVRGATEPVAEYLRRRHRRVTEAWRASIAAADAERGASRYERGDRPLASEPIDWDFSLDLDAALERARAAGRPAFVLFEEDFNERGKFLDLYTWCDAEVAEVMRGFHPIRIHRGLDLTDSETRYGISKGPAYVFVATDGRALQFTDRKSARPVDYAKNFRPPQEMVVLLRESLERIAGEAFDPIDR